MKKITSNDALYYTEDLLNRAFIQFVLLGDTAKTLIEGFHTDLDGQIDIGILNKDYTESGKRVLLSVLPRDSKVTKKEISFVYGEIPVKIKIIHKNYQFFENPEHIIHKISDFCVPNPFDKYYKTRNLIQ
jgi:hypothetical protein